MLVLIGVIVVSAVRKARQPKIERPTYPPAVICREFDYVEKSDGTVVTLYGVDMSLSENEGSRGRRANVLLYTGDDKLHRTLLSQAMSLGRSDASVGFAHTTIETTATPVIDIFIRDRGYEHRYSGKPREIRLEQGVKGSLIRRALSP